MSKSAGLLEAFRALEVRYAAEKRYAAETRQAEPTTVLAWAERHRRIDSQPFTLSRFEPLRALYLDDHPHIAVIKPAQRGVSEWAINYTTFALDRGADLWTDGAKDGLNVGYVFPTREALGDFSKERISGLMQESTHLAGLFSGDDDFNAITFKQVGRSYLYLRGGWSESALLSFAADVLVLDEFDRMDAKAVALARRRMNASMVRRELDISTPTVPGRGIHAQYLQSDRQVYEQACARCDAWVSFDFFRDVRVDGLPYDEWRRRPAELIRASDVTLHCPSCQIAWPDAERCKPGRWRAEAPEVASLRGYWVPWWPFPVVDLVEYACTAVSADPTEVTELYRSDLGAPYEAAGTRITAEQVAALSAGLPGGLLPDMPWWGVTMGADIGKRLHYRISAEGTDGGLYVLAAGSVPGWDELDGLMAQYNVEMAVLDAQPEQHAARDFVARWPGRAVSATYPTGAAALQARLYAPDAVKAVDDGKVQVNRTMAMDGVYAAIGRRQEHWPAALCNDPEVITHLTAPVRVEVTDAHGQPRADWVHTKPDHIYHACLVAGTMVKTEHGDMPIETIRAGMRVWTRRGLRTVKAAGMTASDAAVTTYSFSNGASITGTPNHPIHTENRGFIPLDTIVYNDIITPWPSQKTSSIVASCGGAIRRVSAALIACITCGSDAEQPSVQSAFTSKSGLTTMARYQTDTSYTTATRTPSTTSRKTWCASLSRSIAHTITNWSGLPGRILMRSGRLLTGGTDHPTADGGTASTPTGLFALSSHGRTPATTAASNSKPCRQPKTTDEGHARMPATAPLVVPAASMMLTASAWYAVARFASTAIARSELARVHAAAGLKVRLRWRRPDGRADVYNLSVEGAEEYYANGLLVHNCVYDRIARALLPPLTGGGLLATASAHDRRIT